MTFTEPRSSLGKAPVLPAALALGPVDLTVKDVARSADWYARALGLRVHTQDPPNAELGDGLETVVELHGDPDARPAGRHAGLYHYALLYPSRQELARAALRLAATRTPIQGASDHGTHEAIYLADPDGNGLELAADRPRERWPTPEQEFSRGGPLALDLESLLSTVAGEAPGPQAGEGLRVGHVHLHVGDVEAGLRFYRDVLGFEVWAQLPSAAFVSAGGYHHHLAFNTWKGRGVGPGPEHTVGLRHWTLRLPSQADLIEVRARVTGAGLAIEDTEPGFAVRDPWEIAVRIEVWP
jgi:catechol 2,3-dioxygenase